MSRSSIFSFETLDLTGLRPIAAAGCLVILLCVEVFAARSEWLWAAVEQSPTGVVDALEEHVIARSDDPRVLVLGNSRARDAIIPVTLAESLDLPPRQVLNLSLTAGMPHDSLVMYRRNRAKFADAELLIVGIDAWDFETPRVPTERFRRFATFQERLTYYSGEDRLSLLVGYFWRTLDAKMPLGRIFKKALLNRETDLEFEEDGRIVWHRDDADRDDGVQRANALYGDREPGPLFLRPLVELLQLAEADGVRVVFFRPPLRRSFLQRRAELAPHADDRLEAALQILGRSPTVAGALTDADPGEYSIETSDFFDYGHLRRSGAEKITHALAAWLRTRGIGF